MNLRVNPLSATSSTLSGSTRAQPGRFGTVNPTGSVIHSANEQIPQSTNFGNRTYQSHSHTIGSISSNSLLNKDPNVNLNTTTNDHVFGGEALSLSRFNSNQRTNDAKISMTNNSNLSSTIHFDSRQSSFNQKNSFGKVIRNLNKMEKITVLFQVVDILMMITIK